MAQVYAWVCGEGTVTTLQHLDPIKRFVPHPLRRWITHLVQTWQVWTRLRCWLHILVSRVPTEVVTVSYGVDHVPGANEAATGGIVKFQRMQALYPNSPRRFNLLYLVSSRLPNDWAQLLWLVRHKRIPLVLNQNGVAYPAWYGTGWEKPNQRAALLLHQSAYVFYQSEFCKRSCDHFLGERRGLWEILYNAVDITHFCPAAAILDASPLILLTTGTAQHSYRMISVMHTLAEVRRQGCNAHLLVAGVYRWGSGPQQAMDETHQLIRKLRLEDAVTFIPGYKQSEAPQIYQRAHIFLHTQYNDASPGVVVEALACGLPVVYSSSGGVPELVGEAGIGVPAPLDWETIHPPEPGLLAAAILRVAEQRQHYARLARQRAVEQFDLGPWLQRHREVFERLIQ